MNIGIIEDDLLQRTTLRNWLEDAGHHCRCYGSADEFRRLTQPPHSQLLLLDWELPGISGIELLNWLRTEQHNNTPVIFITTHDTEEDIVLALECGADDYLVKPARRQELLARIGALDRRNTSAGAGTQIYKYGHLSIDTVRQAISLNGEPVELTNKEYSLARFLLKNSGKLLSREILLKRVWGHAGKTSSRTVDTHISRLRKKLRLTPEYGWHLGSVYQYGYRLDYLHNLDGMQRS